MTLVIDRELTLSPDLTFEDFTQTRFYAGRRSERNGASFVLGDVSSRHTIEGLDGEYGISLVFQDRLQSVTMLRHYEDIAHWNTTDKYDELFFSELLRDELIAKELVEPKRISISRSPHYVTDYSVYIEYNKDNRDFYETHTIWITNTEELEKHIARVMKSIDVTIKDLNARGIFIEDIDEASVGDEGTYLLCREDCTRAGYNRFYTGHIKEGHKEIGEPETHLKAYLYPHYRNITYDIAFDFARNVDCDGMEKNRVACVKQLELLKRCDSNYAGSDYFYERALEESTNFIKRFPHRYNDGLGLNLDLSLLERVREKTKGRFFKKFLSTITNWE